MHEKAVLIGKLKEAGKAQSATIEFSEILEYSRALREELTVLKKFIIKQSINSDNSTVIAENPVKPEVDEKPVIPVKIEEPEELPVDDVEEIEPIEDLEEV